MVDFVHRVALGPLASEVGIPASSCIPAHGLHRISNDPAPHAEILDGPVRTGRLHFLSISITSIGSGLDDFHPTEGVFGMASISERENSEIEAANTSGNTPVVFIHGLWLLPSSWASWADFFQQAGYAPLTPDWPDDPGTVEQARANPDVLAKKTLKQVADHTTEIINALDKKPAVMGHSTGGLLAQMLAGRGLSAVTVAIDPGVFRGVLPLPASVLKGVGPFLVNPLTRGRAITLTFDQFKYGWVNALDDKEEARDLYDTFHVAGSGIALVQMGNANLNPWTEAKVDTTNPDRGPLLIIDGEKDHTVPWAIANAAYKRQRRNPGVTEIVKIQNRGHSLTIDHGWREVAQTALDFVNRFA
jgi:pimeloyl-ACP methyl ester carboxylesterase